MQQSFQQPSASESGPVCRNLSPGGTQAIDSSVTTLPARYYLTRGQDVNGHATYQAVIPVTFVADGACRTTPCADQRSPYYDQLMARANTCLQQAAPSLRGGNGETLSVQLAPPSSGGMGPFQIELTPSLPRGDSQHWDTNWGCPEITHEVMHLLGLVDENHEMSLVEGNSYDCRATGPLDSLMSDPQRAFNVSSPMLQGVECHCDGVADPACPAAIAQLQASPEPPASCPPPTREQIYPNTPEWVSQRFAPADRLGQAAPGRYRFTRRGTGTRQSLLYPAEFNAIVAPGCQSNRLYYACSMNAYRSSTETRGCVQNLPAECANATWITGP